MTTERNWFADAELLSPELLKEFGKTLIVAPHQDDESLGCGGTIALLRQLHLPVHVLFVSDGSMSHPNSKAYPTEKLIKLRENESIHALQILDVDQDDITFLHLKDSKLPSIEMPGFDEAVNSIREILLKIKPQTIIIPWQRDPHPDHRSTWQIMHEAINQIDFPVKKLEYLIWLWERANESDLPDPQEHKIWEVNIEQTLVQKKEAIAAHISQTTTLIDDDPEGFILSPEVLAHFDKKTEIFIERLS